MSIKPAKASHRRPSVFEFEGYRAFLLALFSYRKSSEPRFTHRSFAQEAGFSSPNFIKLVMDGERNLTPESLEKLLPALKLSDEESGFFRGLVDFEQSQSSFQKTELYERLSKTKGYLRIKSVEKRQYKYYSKWYYTAIRELVTFSDFQEDPNWIARKLGNRITPKEAQSAISLLLKLMFLSRDGSGKLIQTQSLIQSGEEVKALAIKKFHREMLSKASQSLDETASGDRDISALTLGVSKELMPELKRKIVHFRKELMLWMEQSQKPSDRVIQLNIQLFPLSEESDR